MTDSTHSPQAPLPELNHSNLLAGSSPAPPTAPDSPQSPTSMSSTAATAFTLKESLSGSTASGSDMTTHSQDESLSFALDYLPQSLYGGGISAMSSRRPSYAAEFSSRSKLLDLPNSSSEMANSNFQPQPHPHLQNLQQTSHQQLFQQHLSMSGSKEFSGLPSAATKSSTMPLFESDRWLRSGDPSRSIWFNNNGNSPSNTRPDMSSTTTSQPATTKFSPGTKASNVPASPNTGSLLLSSHIGNVNGATTGKSPTSLDASISPVAPHGPLNDFALETALGSQRNFRSVSFSHSLDRRQMSSRSPPKSHTLGSFLEDSVEEAADALENTHIEEPNRRILKPQKSHQLLMNPTTSHNLWFNEHSASPGSAPNSAAAAAAVAAALNRRHSLATTVDSHLHLQQTQPALRHASINVIGSPVTATASADRLSPPNSSRAYAFDDPHGTNDNLYAEVSGYFNSDEFGRNNAILNSDSVSEISPASAASLISVSSSKLFFVQFKASRVDVFFIPETSSLSVQVDDLVIVDADRGRDLGKVIRVNVTTEEAGMLKWKQHQDQQAALQQAPGDPGSNGAPSGPSVMTPKQILRYAQPTEIQQILVKQSDEETAIKMCSTKVQEKNLAMAVLDAEYQWDRRKLTFFYSASYRIDFRDLVRDLFRIYKTRIWMCAVHTGQPQQLQPQYRQLPPGPQQDRMPMGDYRYPQDSIQQPQDFAGAPFNPWQFSNPAMGNRMMVPPSQAPPPPQYWNPMMYNHYGPSSQGPSTMPGSMVPGGSNFY